SADRADRDEFIYTNASGDLHQLGAHDQVVVEKLPRSFAVGADPANDRCQVDYDVRARLSVHALHCVELTKIVALALRSEYMGGAARSYRLYHVRSEKPMST